MSDIVFGALLSPLDLLRILAMHEGLEIMVIKSLQSDPNF